MSMRIQSLLGLRSRSKSRDPSERAESLQPPQTTRKIQEMLDWQTLDNHFASSAKPDKPLDAFRDLQSETMDTSSTSTSHSPCEVAMTGSPTHHTEHELLVCQFQEAHAEVARRACELKDMVLQVGKPQDDTQQGLQKIYKQLVKDSTELLSALAHKMSRLRTKMDLSRSVSSKKSRAPSAEASSQGRHSLSHKNTDDSRQRAWFQPKPPEKSPTSSYPSVRRCGKQSVPDENTRPSSVSSAPSVRRKSMHSLNNPYRSSVETRRSLPAEFEIQSSMAYKDEFGDEPKTFDQLPQLDPDEVRDVDQPSTLPDLPCLDMDFHGKTF